MKLCFFPSKVVANFVVFLFSLFVVNSSFPSAFPVQEKSADLIIREGVELYKSGRYEDAIEKFKQVEGVTQDANLQAQAYICLSLSYYWIEDTENSKQWLIKACRTQPNIESSLFLTFPTGYEDFFKRIKNEYCPPLPIPTLGNIQVNSVPPEADVYLDGADSGKKTNCLLENVSPGAHTIMLKKEGYEDFSNPVTVTADETASIEATLEKESNKSWLMPAIFVGLVLAVGIIYLAVGSSGASSNTSTMGRIQGRLSLTRARAYFDGINQEKITNYVLAGISTGLHAIKLEKDRYGANTQAVNIQPGRTARADVGPTKIAIKITKPVIGTTWLTSSEVLIEWQISPGVADNGETGFRGHISPIAATHQLSCSQNLKAPQAYPILSGWEGIGLKSSSRYAEAWEGITSNLLGQVQGRFDLSAADYPRTFPVETPSPPGRKNDALSPMSNLPSFPFIPPNSFFTAQDASIMDKGSSLAISKVKIDLYKEGWNDYREIERETENDGSYVWKIPSDLPSGTGYVIRISAVSDSELYSESNTFNIVSSELTNATDIISHGVHSPPDIAPDPYGIALIPEIQDHRVAKSHLLLKTSAMKKSGTYPIEDEQFYGPRFRLADEARGFLSVVDSRN